MLDGQQHTLFQLPCKAKPGHVPISESSIEFSLQALQHSHAAVTTILTMTVNTRLTGKPDITTKPHGDQCRGQKATTACVVIVCSSHDFINGSWEVRTWQ